jgi:hypothetical protein
MRDHNLCYGRYACDEYGRPLDPPADNALFGPRVAEFESVGATDAADRQQLQNPPFSADEQLAFADRLFEANEWDRARIEYARLLFHEAGIATATPHARRCHERIALCFAHLKRRGDAFAALDRLPAGAATDDLRALVLRELGQHEDALAAVDTRDADGQLLAGFLALETGRSDVARAQFGRLDAPLRDPLLEHVSNFDELPTKSLWLAGSLSAVLPGAGQLYAGRWEDGLVAFTTNAVLIGATALAWHRDERVTAGALGCVAFGFYAGNVYGGVNAAARHDRAVRDGALARMRGWLRQSNLWVGVAPRGEGGALGIYFGF